MKILQETKETIINGMPLCRSHSDVQALFQKAQIKLQDSQAPFGQRQMMWREIKEKLSTLSRRPEVINDAHAIISVILKRMT